MALFVAGIMSCCFLVAAPAETQLQSLGPSDTFRAAALSSAEIGEILKQVQDSAFDIPDDWQKELHVRHFDLGSSPGVVLQGTKLLCGATRNCQTWVFRKAHNNWILMFANDDVPIAEGFRLGPCASGGIKDFAVQANSSAEAERTVTYRFDGGLYRRK
jgi:hypothetical protein